jgi:hypothetical protein
MVLAFDRAGRKAERDHFLAEMDKALTKSPTYKNAAGLPYATNEGTPAYGSWLMQDSPLCVSSTAWYISAKENYNPFSMDQKDHAANKIIDGLSYRPAYQFAPVADNFEYSKIKFETAYPKQLMQSNKAKIERGHEEKAVKGGSRSMKIVFQPDSGAANSWGSINRPFLHPQNWGKYSTLSLWIFCENSAAIKIKIKDKEAEPFETRPVYLDRGEWKKISFNLKDDFIRGPSLPNYGNNQFDKDGVRELSIELSPRDNTGKTVIYIDDITLD